MAVICFQMNSVLKNLGLTIMILKVIKVYSYFQFKIDLPNSWTQCYFCLCFKPFVDERICQFTLPSDETNTEIPPCQECKRLRCVFPDEYCKLGPSTAICSKYNARMWKEKRVNTHITKRAPIISMCHY